MGYVVDPVLSHIYSANEVVKDKITIASVVKETTNTYDGGGFPLTANVSEKQLPNGTPETSKLKFEY